jgi:hypothetical protein
MSTSFQYRRSGINGCEICDPDGQVVAWTVDVGWAGIIIGALNMIGSPRPTPWHQRDGGTGQAETNDDYVV